MLFQTITTERVTFKQLNLSFHQNNKHYSSCELSQNLLAQIALVKYKQEIVDTLEERCRLGNYVCIYPSQGSKVYDYFFINEKPVNTAIYEFLYSESNGILKDLSQDVITEVWSKLIHNKLDLKTNCSEPFSQYPSTVALNKPSSNPTITEYMIEYLAQLVIWVQDYDDKSIKASYKDMIYNFVSHKNWSKKLLNSSNFKIINNNDLISKLCERLDDIIFGSYHFSEFKNSGVDHNIYNTFEFSKTLSRRLKKSIKRKTKPAILKEEIK